MARSKNNQLEEKWGQWMRRAQEGDRNSYSLLLSDLAIFLPRYLVKHVQNSQMADDICQEVLISIHKARHTWNPERSFMPWFMAIVKHRTIDEIRKWARIKKTEVQNDHYLQVMGEGTVENSLLHKELEETVMEAINNLPEKQRKSLKLLKIDGHSVKEASSMTGISESAIKVSAHRAYKSLRKSIGGWLHES